MDLKRYPNAGRKVLLFSDSRQRAAKLARDMSEISDISAARKLFVLAIKKMCKDEDNLTLNDLYGYFCAAASEKNVVLFSGSNREKFIGDCQKEKEKMKRAEKFHMTYKPSCHMENAPPQMEEDVIRLFAGGYNTLYDHAECWLKPKEEEMNDAIYQLSDELGISDIVFLKEQFMEVFNAWLLSIFDSRTALGHGIPDSIRQKVRLAYDGRYGLDKDWDFNTVIKRIMGWSKNKKEKGAWIHALDNFLDISDTHQKYLQLSKVCPVYDPAHIWYQCKQCSGITPFKLKGCCPSCGSSNIHPMNEKDLHALDYWRLPIDNALKGNPIRVIDTEEHTAQLSHKDQRDELWSKTENYEMRFQDILSEGETPVDILSSTTTMEVGIDIGSLIAIGMRNIPPMRENYQQRSGRAGRRGAVLSTIVTFCEDGPHDTLYFNNPVRMFRGEPRKPWIDTESPKLLQRHLSIVLVEEYLQKHDSSLDQMSASDFLDKHLEQFKNFAEKYSIRKDDLLIPQHVQNFKIAEAVEKLNDELQKLKQKRDNHPELYEGVKDVTKPKSLLDALYEEGIIPTYSFPKNVVSTYIMTKYSSNSWKCIITALFNFYILLGKNLGKKSTHLLYKLHSQN